MEVPDFAAGEIADQSGVAGGVEGLCPDDGGVVDVGGVVDPFLEEDVSRGVVDEDEVLFAGLLEVGLNSGAVGVPRGVVRIGDAEFLKPAGGDEGGDEDGTGREGIPAPGRDVLEGNEKQEEEHGGVVGEVVGLAEGIEE